ncbi:MAG: oligosaccharide flippase family protein [Clostridia bacterium]|nr:oligosaccharide flippase family protein [Clostridia bacterium]
MRKQSFIMGSIILALGGVLAKGLGAFYKIPLTNILGTTGIGIYYLIFPIFSFVLTMSSSGVATALNIVVAKERKKHNRKNEFRYLKVALVIAFVISAIFMAFIMIFAKDIAYIQGNVNATLSYMAIAPAVVISSQISVVRGYFQGVENMIPTTISMIIEQIVKMCIGLIFAYITIPYGVEYAVLSAVMGVTASEIIALIIIVINFVVYKKKLDANIILYRENYILDYAKPLLKKKVSYLKTKQQKAYYKKRIYTYKEIVVDFLKLALPLTLTKLIAPLILLVDSFVVINLFLNVGYSVNIATSLYGISTGVVSTITGLTAVVTTSITTAIIPKINDSVSDKARLENISFIFKFVIMVGVVLGVGIFIGADSIITILYGGALNNVVIDEVGIAINLLTIASISIIYSGVIQISNIILQSIGKAMVAFVVTFILALVRVLVLVILVYLGLNVYAMEIADVVFLGVSCILLVWQIKKVIGFSISTNFIVGAITMFALGAMVGNIINELLQIWFNGFIATLISIGLVYMIYAISLYYSNIFTIREKEILFFRYKKKSITTKILQK